MCRSHLIFGQGSSFIRTYHIHTSYTFNHKELVQDLSTFKLVLFNIQYKRSRDFNAGIFLFFTLSKQVLQF